MLPRILPMRLRLVKEPRRGDCFPFGAPSAKGQSLNPLPYLKIQLGLKEGSFVTTEQSDLSGQRLQRFQKIVRDRYPLDSGSHYRLRSGLTVA